MTSCATVPTTISDSAVEILNQIASSVAANASPTQSAAKSPSVRHMHELLNCHSGIGPGHDSATGFPVRSHHLSGLLDGQRLRVNSLTTYTYTIEDCLENVKPDSLPIQDEPEGRI